MCVNMIGSCLLWILSSSVIRKVLAGNSSGPSYNPYGSPLSTNGHLWCYECKESYANNLRSHGSGTGSSGYDPLNSPCSNNLSAITIRQCGPEAVYCKFERADLLGWSIQSVERGCASTCEYGCRFNGYGVTVRRCTTCCRTDSCNTQMAAAPTNHLRRDFTIMMTSLCGILVSLDIIHPS